MAVALPAGFHWVTIDGLVRNAGYRPDRVLSMTQDVEVSNDDLPWDILIEFPLGLYIPDGYAVVVVSEVSPDSSESQNESDEGLRLSIQATFNTEDTLRYADVNHDGKLNLSGALDSLETSDLRLCLPAIELLTVWN